MITKEDQVRATIAEQAAGWLVANDEEPLDAQQSAALAAWLKASPVHVEEFLRASVVARDLHEARTDPEYSVEAVLAQAHTADDSVLRSLWPRVASSAAPALPGRWLTGAASLVAVVVLGIGVTTLWRTRAVVLAPVPAVLATLKLETGHGEQLTRRLADNSVLHLDTDSAVIVRFSGTERLVTLTAGQAAFEVAHEATRKFRVLGGSAEVIAIGTQFDVRLKENSTEVTVLEGRVDVGLLPAPNSVAAKNSPRYVQVSANQRIRVVREEWPSAPQAADAQQAVGWLNREIVFDHEPLERVAAEFNRYAPRPIEIATPALRNLQISGAFATDDTDAFIAFLRTLKGVRVEVTATHIRVSQQ